jgi:hypothetical protein
MVGAGRDLLVAGYLTPTLVRQILGHIERLAWSAT